jgi:hypothetical protein
MFTRMSDLRCRTSYFRATPSCSKHPRIPTKVVGIWTEPFEQRVHPIGLVSSKTGCKIRFSCKSYPEKMAMATRHPEALWAPQTPLMGSESFTVWIWVPQDKFPRPCKGLKEGDSALATVPTPCKLGRQRPPSQIGSMGVQICTNGLL